MSQFKETVTYLKNRRIDAIDSGIVLGTGLGQFIGHIDVIQSIPYSEIPHFPVSTVESHKGNLIYGTVGDKKVLAMQGRFHYYEGYTMQQITFPIRIMKILGVKHVLLSNAAGGLHPDFKKGDLVLLDDHINFLPENPLTGPNIDELGPRFPDMSEPYSKKLNDMVLKAAKKNHIVLKKGVYVAVPGPNLETRAEYRFLRMIGADMVGMSTVPEVIVANHMGLPCSAVSVITDECDPDNLHPINISQIIEAANKADHVLSTLIADTVKMVECAGVSVTEVSVI